MKNLIITFLVLLMLSSGSCGGGSSSDSSSGGSGETATSTDVENAASATVETVMLVLSILFGGDDSSANIIKSFLPEDGTNIKVGDVVKDYTIEETTECSGMPLPSSPSGDTITVEGSQLSANGSGSCTVTTEGFSPTENYEAAAAILDCDSFTGAEATQYVTLDGRLGVTVESVETTDKFNVRVVVGTPSMLMGFIEDGSTKICEIATYVTQRTLITIGETSATAVSDVTGCISVCDTPYTVTGSETQTVTFEE